MAPIENASGYRHPENYNSSESVLQLIAIAVEKREIKPFPKDEASLQVLPYHQNERLIPFRSAGGIIISHDSWWHLYYHPTASLGPYTTYSLEYRDTVFKALGCQTVKLTGQNKEFLSLTIGEREIKIFLGETQFSEGSRWVLENNKALASEATVAIAAILLTPGSLLAQAVKEGIFTGRIESENTIVGHTALLPAKRLGITGALSDENYLLPIPLREGRGFGEGFYPRKTELTLERLQTILDPENPNSLNPVVICWQKT